MNRQDEVETEDEGHESLGTDSTLETMLLAEASLAVDWLRPEEDEAWAYMQPSK